MFGDLRDVTHRSKSGWLLIECVVALLTIFLPTTNTQNSCLTRRSRPDIGLAEASLAEMIVEAVEACHPALRGLLYSNVFLMGGTCRCPGFLERLKSELRPLVPDAYEVRRRDHGSRGGRLTRA